jgi:oligoendopeptidase F
MIQGIISMFFRQLIFEESEMQHHEKLRTNNGIE